LEGSPPRRYLNRPGADDAGPFTRGDRTRQRSCPIVRCIGLWSHEVGTDRTAKRNRTEGCMRLSWVRFDERQHASPARPSATTRDEGGRLGRHAVSGPWAGDGVTEASGDGRSQAPSDITELLSAAVLRSAQYDPPGCERTLGTQVGRAVGTRGSGPKMEVRERSGADHRGVPRELRAVGDVIVGKRGRAGAASSKGRPAAHAGGHGIPASLPAVWCLWGEHASAVAGDDAAREFWAPRLMSGHIC
jgi:hypothetical protein